MGKSLVVTPALYVVLRLKRTFVLSEVTVAVFRGVGATWEGFGGRWLVEETGEEEEERSNHLQDKKRRACDPLRYGNSLSCAKIIHLTGDLLLLLVNQN